MKFRSLLCLLLAVLALIPFCSFSAAAADELEYDPSISKGCRTIDAQVPLYGSEKKLETAKSAMLYEVGSDTIMYSWNPDEKLPPASIVKIITCVLVLENGNTQDIIVVSESVLSQISSGAATLDLVPGEKITVEDLLYALMVGSSNDAAVILADHIAGSQSEFVAMMNQWVAKVGCKDTNITNAHGLHDEAQYTTARDVVRIVAEAMKDERFMNYFSATYYDIPATNVYPEKRRVETTNYLRTISTELYYDSRVTGGRTGITNDSKRSIVVTAESNGMSYIAVVLSATPEFGDDGKAKRFGSYEEAKQLLDMGFVDHSVRQLLYDGQILTQCNVENGRNAVSLGSTQSVIVALPTETTWEDLTFRYTSFDGALSAPIEAGQQITAVEVWYGSVCVAYSPVIAMNGSAVDDGSLLQENQFGGKSKAWVIVLIILVVLIVLVLLVLIGIRVIHTLNHAKAKRRHRRRRQERRRTR